MQDENKTVYVFEVPGEPVAQGRPRFSRRGGFITAYDPAKSRNYKVAVRLMVQQQMQGKKIIEDGCKATIDIFRGIPASWSKKKRTEALAGKIRPVTKPDTDNYIKIILDSLNSIVYKDDNLILEITARKWYSDTPKVLVKIETL